MFPSKFVHTYNPRERYAFSRQELGSGTYGKVLLAHDLASNAQRAIKIITKLYIKQWSAEKHVKNEITFLSTLNHKNIISFYEWFEDCENIYIVLEFLPCGTLYSLVKSQGRLSEEEAFSYFTEVAQGLLYMHSRDVVHRDIKADNILLGKNQVKICDLNWSIQLPNGAKASPCHCGTTEYMPPEVVKKQPHDSKVDVWSLGVLLYYMLHGKLPFQANDKKGLIEKIGQDPSYKLNEGLSVQCKALINSLLSPGKRPSMEQVMDSQWVKTMELKKKVQVLTPPFSQLTPVKSRSSAYEQNRFSANSLSTNNSFGKSSHHSFQRVETPALDQSVLAFRTDRKQ